MKAKNADYVSAVGRRKEAVARIRLTKGNGQITVNGKAINELFPSLVAQKTYQKPFFLTNSASQYSASVKVYGGGVSSQIDAIIHGISRALVLADPALRPTLKKEGLLRRDPRVKERRKYGHAQKARAKKQSPKR